MAISHDAKVLYYCALSGVSLWILTGIITMCLIPHGAVYEVIERISDPWDKAHATLRTSWVEDYHNWFFSAWGFGFNWLFLSLMFAVAVLCRVFEAKSLVWGSSASTGAKLLLAYSALCEVVKMIVLMWSLCWMWHYGSEANFRVARDKEDSGFKYEGDYEIFKALTSNNENHAYVLLTVILGFVSLALEFCGIYNIILGHDSILQDMTSVKAAYRNLQGVQQEDNDQGAEYIGLVNHDKDLEADTAAFVRV